MKQAQIKDMSFEDLISSYERCTVNYGNLAEQDKFKASRRYMLDAISISKEIISRPNIDKTLLLRLFDSTNRDTLWISATHFSSILPEESLRILEQEDEKPPDWRTYLIHSTLQALKGLA